MDDYMNLIDVNDASTFSLVMRDVFKELKNVIPFNELEVIKSKPVDTDIDICQIIEKYFSPSTCYDTYQEVLIPIFSRYELACYHVTRVTNIEHIRQGGITSSIGEYYQRLSAFLRDDGVKETEIELVISAISAEYARKYGDNPYFICFFINCSAISEYSYYSETIGGELAEWTLMDNNPEILHILQTKGFPIAIKFRIPFMRITDFHKDRIIYGIIKQYMCKQFFNHDCCINAEGTITGDVTPENIMDIYVLNDNNDR